MSQASSLPILAPPAAAEAPACAEVLPLDPRTYDRALSCVHCGLCLPACPTYVTTGHEGDSPRGRIQLMRGLADGAIEPTDTVLRHLDLCLDCRGCETACPSGVIYHELIEEARVHLKKVARPPMQSRFIRFLSFHLFTRPGRLKVLLLGPRILQKVGLYGLMRRAGLFRILPRGLAKMESMLPPKGKLWPRRLPERVPARGTKKRTVGFLPGCIGSVMFEKVNRQAVELLSAGGAEVVIPRALGCCGAIHHHNGAWEPARAMARRNIEALEGVDVIATTIAGCGAMLHEYDHLLRDDEAYAARARAFAAKVKDVSQVLLELGLPEMPHRVERVATYHDACHLAHAQKVVAAPRILLASVPGLRLVPLPESDLCCGAAGTYNLTQPAMATELASRKLRNVATTGAGACITGNVGCAMHIQSQADAQGQALRVMHPVEVVHEAVFGAGAKR